MSTLPGKRKRPSENAAGRATGAEGTGYLPIDLWNLVAARSQPIEIYNLCLTSRLFHESPTGGFWVPALTPSEQSTRPSSAKSDLRKAPSAQQGAYVSSAAASSAAASSAAAKEGASAAAKGETFHSAPAAVKDPYAIPATQLLRTSLLASLRSVLGRFGVDPCIVCSTPASAPGAVISGSTMAQVCLGENWKGADLDIFCTAAAAPKVRSALVGNGKALAGFCDTYCGVGFFRHEMQTEIHHVEKWAKWPQTVPQSERPKDARGLEDDFDFAEACERGKNINHDDYDLNRRFPGGSYYGEWKSGFAPEHHIVVASGELPFDFRLERDSTCEIDVVVASSGAASALELLNSFDLSICKASWDGNTFRIPHPHLTFARKSITEPFRRSVMVEYMNGYGQPIPGTIPSTDEHNTVYEYMSPQARMQLQARMQRIQAGVMNAVAKVLVGSPQVKPFEFSERTDWNTNLNWSVVAYHNWIVALFKRLQRYTSRGIHVKDAPEGALALAGKLHIEGTTGR